MVYKVFLSPLLLISLPFIQVSSYLLPSVSSPSFSSLDLALQQKHVYRSRQALLFLSPVDVKEKEIQTEANTEKITTNNTIKPEDIALPTDENLKGIDNLEMDEKTKNILKEISSSKQKRNEAAERLEKGWKEIQQKDQKKMEEFESAQQVTLKIMQKRKQVIDSRKEEVEQLVDELENSSQSKLYRFLQKVFFLDLRRFVAVVLLLETIYVSYLVGVVGLEDMTDSSLVINSLGLEVLLGAFYAYLNSKEKGKERD